MENDTGYCGKKMDPENLQEAELKEILYDEALKLLNNCDEAKALTEEVFLDFITCHTTQR